jgi:hypothetical protein
MRVYLKIEKGQCDKSTFRKKVNVIKSYFGFLAGQSF